MRWDVGRMVAKPRKILAWGNISSSLVLTMRIWSCEASSRDMRRVEHCCSQVSGVGGAPPYLTAAPHLPLGVEPKIQRAESTAGATMRCWVRSRMAHMAQKQVELAGVDVGHVDFLVVVDVA